MPTYEVDVQVDKNGGETVTVEATDPANAKDLAIKKHIEKYGATPGGVTAWRIEEVYT